MTPLFRLSLPAPEAWQLGIQPGLRRLWRWWLGELRQLLPHRLRHLAPLNQRMIFLDIDDEHIEVAIRSEDGLQKLGSIGLSPGQTSPDTLRKMLQVEAQRHSRAIVRLAQHQILIFEIGLPAAARENLRQLLGYEIDRYTPFTTDTCCFDYRIISATPDRITIRLYVATRTLIERVLTQARQFGISLHAVSIIDTKDTDPLADQVSTMVNLLPETLRERPDSRQRLLKRSLAATAAGLLAVNLTIPFWLQNQRLIHLEQDLERAKISSTAALELHAEHTAFVAALEHIGKSRKAAPAALRVLDELSTLLPDNTWLSRLELKSGTVQLQGESSASAALIGLIEASPLFESAAFRASITQDPRTGKENFQIHARLTPEEAR